MDTEKMAPKSTFGFRRLWLLLGWMIVLSVISLSLTPAPIPIPVAEADKLEHLLAYGTLMVWFSNIYEDSIRRATLAISFVAMGIALEFIQQWTGFRTFEIADMAANASGVVVRWAIAPPRTLNFLRRIETSRVLAKWA
jgi:VanZ family protein